MAPDTDDFKTVLYVFVLLMFALVLGTVSTCSHADEAPASLGEAIMMDFKHVNGKCLKAFEMEDYDGRVRAAIYYGCVSLMYRKKHDSSMEDLEEAGLVKADEKWI